MYTYIIESQGYYKIGKARDIDDRLRSYDTCNPVYQLIHVIGFNCETFLHNRFKEKRFKNEWFSLTEEDLLWIKNNEKFIKEILDEIERIKENKTYNKLPDSIKNPVNLQKMKKHLNTFYKPNEIR